MAQAARQTLTIEIDAGTRQASDDLMTRAAMLIQSAASRVMRAHRNRKAIGDLRQLDDRMLRDIGIERSEIVSVVNGGSSHNRR